MVSVAMATYNGSKYIREQIESILNQTYKNIELVIIDDCSTDDTVDILLDYQKKDSRIRLYQNDKNLGFVKNFEKAILLCEGEYIALSDDDDVWTPDHIKILLENIGNYCVVCGNPNLIDGEGNNINLTYKEQEVLDDFPDDSIKELSTILFFRNPFQGASMLLTKDFVKHALPIPENVRVHDVWFSLLSCMMGKFKYIDKVIGSYRMHGNNASGSRTTKMSRFKTWYQIGLHGVKGDRIPYIKGILERCPSLTAKESIFMENMEKRFTRATGIRRPLQKLSNWIYITLHYKTIFSIKYNFPSQ